MPYNDFNFNRTRIYLVRGKSLQIKLKRLQSKDFSFYVLEPVVVNRTISSQVWESVSDADLHTYRYTDMSQKMRNNSKNDQKSIQRLFKASQNGLHIVNEMY